MIKSAEGGDRMPFGYDSDRVAAELQLQKRVRQAELALAKADRPLPQEPRVPSTREVDASPRSLHFGAQIQRWPGESG